MWMPFQKKFDRARRFQRGQRGLPPEEARSRSDGEEDPALEVEETPISEQMEKGDMGAMLLAAFFTLFLPSMLIIGVMVLIAFLLFRVI